MSSIRGPSARSPEITASAVWVGRRLARSGLLSRRLRRAHARLVVSNGLREFHPDLLGCKLRELFVPSRRLRPLFELLLAGLSMPRPSRSEAAGEGGNKAKPVRTGLRVAYAALVGYPVASAVGALPGLAVVLTAMTLDSWQRAGRNLHIGAAIGCHR